MTPGGPLGQAALAWGGTDPAERKWVLARATTALKALKSCLSV